MIDCIGCTTESTAFLARDCRVATDPASATPSGTMFHGQAFRECTEFKDYPEIDCWALSAGGDRTMLHCLNLLRAPLEQCRCVSSNPRMGSLPTPSPRRPARYLDTRLLTPNLEYRLCADVDGPDGPFLYGDTGVGIYLSALVRGAPAQAPSVPATPEEMHGVLLDIIGHPH